MLTAPGAAPSDAPNGVVKRCVFDVNGYTQFSAGWDFKTAEQVRFETSFAREKRIPLILGLAVEPHDTSSGRIAEATDAEIRGRLQLWKTSISCLGWRLAEEWDVEGDAFECLGAVRVGFGESADREHLVLYGRRRIRLFRVPR